MERVGRRRDRLVGLLFLTVVVVAVGLLIAGYGVAVGVGALAGLVLGGFAGILGVLWVGRGSGRSIAFRDMGWSSESSGPTAELMAEMHELSDVMSVDVGQTRSVIPVLATVDAGGLSVQLVSVEIHEAGVAMTVDVASHVGTPPPASMAQLAIDDDLQTTYRSSAQGAGGLPGRMRYMVIAIPAPPVAASVLQVRIERFFDPFPGGSRSAVGPWIFSVSIRSTDNATSR